MNLTKISLKNFLKFVFIPIVFTILFLPIIQNLGVEEFLESFENPEYYLLLQNNKKYEVVQLSSHPDFFIESGDTVIYYNLTGKLTYHKINQIKATGMADIYYLSSGENQPIFKSQIVGKIIKETDRNLLNTISMNLWDVSIHNLNIKALVTN